MTTFVRNTHIAERIVFVDGISGSGKSILGPVLGSLERVEKQRIEHIYEYLCILDNFNKIDSDAGTGLMRLYADLAIYNQMISREVNLRPFDNSGLLTNPNPTRYVKRLFYKDGNAPMERVKKSNPILQIMSHQILPVVGLAFKAFGERLRIVEMVRHPVFLLRHWFNYIDRYGKDSREFTLWLDSGGKAVPWFAAGWEAKYKTMQTMDKVIHAISWLTEKSNEAYEKLNNEQKKQILFIPFEKFVTDPWPFMREIEVLLGTKCTSGSKKALKKQKCPRKMLTDGLGHKGYGWKRPDKGSSNLDEFEKRWNFAKNNASKEAIAILNNLSIQYKNKYGVDFHLQNEKFIAKNF